MVPIYIPATQTIIRSPGERYIHPQTGEVYGGTDYDDPAKLAEIGAVPITIAPVSAGYRAVSWAAIQESGAWIYRPTVEADPDVRTALLAAVNVERERRKAVLTVTVDGVVFDADGESRSNIAGILSAVSSGLPVTFPHDWRDAGNVTRSLSQAQLVTLAGTMMGAMKALYDASWTLKDVTIPALTDAQVGTFNVAADEHWAFPQTPDTEA
jgi:hypothetical protein